MSVFVEYRRTLLFFTERVLHPLGGKPISFFAPLFLFFVSHLERTLEAASTLARPLHGRLPLPWQRGSLLTVLRNRSAPDTAMDALPDAVFPSSAAAPTAHAFTPAAFAKRPRNPRAAQRNWTGGTRYTFSPSHRADAGLPHSTATPPRRAFPRS